MKNGDRFMSFSSIMIFVAECTECEFKFICLFTSSRDLVLLWRSAFGLNVVIKSDVRVKLLKKLIK